MASQSLYRKYRPQFFREVKGQEHISVALRNAVKEDRVGHAYLFSGPRGTGKTTSARLLAKALNCLQLDDDGEPCGTCGNCEGVAAGNFADLIELDAASNNGVQAVRDLIEKVHFGVSATGKRKVYVVDEVHMLSSGASNALLKTLEEPPEHVVFILATTDPHKVLPTIRSRTQHFEFSLISHEELSQHLVEIAALEGIEIDAEAIDVVARQGAGSARDAMSKLDMALAVGVGTDGDTKHLDTASVIAAFGGTSFERRVAVLQAIADDDAAGALMAVTSALTSGIDPRELAEELLATSRDAFVLAASNGKVPYGGPAQEAEILSALATAAGLGRCTRAIETFGTAIADMRGQGAPDPRLVLEVAVVRLARRDTGTDVDGLLDRIAALETRVQQLVASGGVSSQTAPSTGPSASPVAPPANGPRPYVPNAERQGPAPVAPTSSASGDAPSAPSSPGPRPALGSFKKRDIAPPSAPPTRVAASVDAAAPTPPPDAAPARTTPIDFDDVVLAWNSTLSNLNAAKRSMVQQAQPIGLSDDTVLFGVPTDQFTAVKSRFKDNADAIREELKRHLGVSVRFKLQAHDFDMRGAFRPQAGMSGGAPDDGVPMPMEPPPDDELPDDVDLNELVDAHDAPPTRDTANLLMSELGAQVVEEHPR